MQNYSYLFTTDKPAGFDQKLRIGTADGQKTEKSFSYTTHSSISGVKMEIGFPLEHSNFENNKIYKLSIVNIPQKENAGITSNITETTTQMDGIKAGIVEITRREATSTIVNLAEKEIYSLTFKTSQHDTFEEKIRSFEQQANGWRDPIYPYIHNINTDLREPELFDAYEIGSANVNAKIVDFTAQTGQTPWFTQTLYNGMYTSQAYLTVPNNKISILQMQAPDKLLSDDEIMINIPSGYGISGVMRYELAYQCALDMTEAKNKIGEKFLHKQTLTAAEIAILNQNFPPVVFQGNYPVTANYTLPGRNTITSTVNFYIYNPINQ
jgi:hypothetical protein